MLDYFCLILDKKKVGGGQSSPISETRVTQHGFRRNARHSSEQSSILESEAVVVGDDGASQCSEVQHVQLIALKPH